MKLLSVLLVVALNGCASFSQPSYNSDGTVQRVSYEDTTPNRAPPSEPVRIAPTLGKWLLILTSMAVNSASETIKSQTYFPNSSGDRNIVHDANELSGRGAARRDTYIRLLNADPNMGDR